jgi:hypothetical protein
MDRLVTNDTDFEKSLNIVKMEKDVELQIVGYEDFKRLL